MRSYLSLPLVALAVATVLFHHLPVSLGEEEVSAHTLPVLFLHGFASNAAAGILLQQNLSTDARPFIALTACENLCAMRPLQDQLKLAIAQIRSLTHNDTRFDKGYVLMGHSQGGALVRGVAAEMDDHKIHTLVSIAGGANGLFYGPQASDALPARNFIDVLAPVMTNTSVFDYTTYTTADISSGKMATDWVTLHAARPDLQAVGSGYNLYRSPFQSKWVEYNPYFPVIGNLQAPTSVAIAQDQARRKQNFLRLRAAHFFASPTDAGISPWQSAVLGAYESVESLEQLARNFKTLRVLPMEETPEYTGDTYGLATLDQRGGVIRHVVENVSHGCWLMDEMPDNGTVECKFQPVFEQTLYPLLRPVQASESVLQSASS